MVLHAYVMLAFSNVLVNFENEILISINLKIQFSKFEEFCLKLFVLLPYHQNPTFAYAPKLLSYGSLLSNFSTIILTTVERSL